MLEYFMTNIKWDKVFFKKGFLQNLYIYNAILNMCFSCVHVHAHGKA